MQFTAAANSAILAASLCLSALTLHAAPATPAIPATPVAPARIGPQPDGLTLHLDSGDLRIQLLSDSVVRVAFARSASFFTRASLDVLPNPSLTTGWKLAERPTSFVLTTARLHVIVDRKSGAISFADLAGHAILSEAAGSRTLEPATVQGETTFHIQQRWNSQPGESLYGLGQMQLGITDIKGYDLDLWQHNTNIVVPFLVSSRGYGILWDNTSFTRFGDLRPFAAIPPANLYDATANTAGSPSRPSTVPCRPARPPASASTCAAIERLAGGRPAPLKPQRWQGSILAPVTGDYQFQAYSNGGIKVWIRWQTRHGPLASELESHQRSGPRPSTRRTQSPHQASRTTLSSSPPSPSSGRLRRPPPAHRSGPRSATASTTPSSTAPHPIRSSPAIVSSPVAPPCSPTGSSASGSRANGMRPPISRSTSSSSSASARSPSTTSCRTGSTGAPTHGARTSSIPLAFPILSPGSTSIHAQHAHLMISVWGKFNPNTDNAKEMNATRLPLPAQSHRAHQGLDQPALHLLRRLQPRSP